MELFLFRSALGLGGIGVLAALLLSWPVLSRQSPRPNLSRSYLVAAIGIAVLGELLSFAAHTPHTLVHGFSLGYLLGTAGALLGFWVQHRSAVEEPSIPTGGASIDSPAQTTPYFLALAVMAVPSLWMRNSLPDAHFGVAIGWFVSTFLTAIGTPKEGAMGQRLWLNQIACLGFVLALLLFAVAGEYRNPTRFGASPAPVHWSAIGFALADTTLCLLFLLSLPFAGLGKLAGRLRWLKELPAQAEAARLLRVMIGTAFLLVAFRFIGSKALEHPPFFLLSAIGSLGMLLVWWLLEIGKLRSQNGAWAWAWQVGALSALLVLVGYMAAYQLLGGFGIGVMLMAAWFVIAARVASTSLAEYPLRVSTLTQMTLIGLFATLLGLYRLFLIRYSDDLWHRDLADHYALFGFLVGVLAPPLVQGYLLSWAHFDRTKTLPLYHFLLTGLLTLLIPGLVLLIYGSKCVEGLFFGLALTTLLPLFQPNDEQKEAYLTLYNLLPTLFSTAMMLALLQWTQTALPWADFAREEKIRIVLLATGFLVLATFAGELGSYLHQGRRPPPQGRRPPPQGRQAKADTHS
jgi:hypothetical protein